MSSFLRRVPTFRLVGTIAAILGVLAAAAAIAVAATSTAPKPPAKSLAAALHDAAAAPRVLGVTARVTFTNQLLGASSIQLGSSSAQGVSPLLSGASGRLWASSDGRLRIELQTERGDMQVLSDSKTLTVYDPTSDTVYKLALPTMTGGGSTGRSSVPTESAIEKMLGRLGADVSISGTIPSNVAGREAYTVQVAPKHDGGLLGSVALAWDANNGTPLRVAVYAAGDSSPVLELKATEISYGAVEASAFTVSPPAHANVVDLAAPMEHSAQGNSEAPITGGSAVQKRLPFTLTSPGTLDGLPQQEVRLASVGSKSAALLVYGKGLGGIAVLEQAAGGSEQTTLGSLPTVSINGATGHELATPLGTVLTLQRGGVSYTVIGSVPPAAAEAAARSL